VSQSREQYIKPTVLQLQYSAEPKVNIAEVCKQSGAVSGPTISSCLRVGPSGLEPCVDIAS
jgi:hypothetical protein